VLVAEGCDARCTGTEFDYVILSTVRSLIREEIEKRPSIGWLHKQLGFIIDCNQINVALTRAKKGLIIIGRLLTRCCDMLLLMYRAICFHCC
jgi:superfamily I DNA and/or RNA helicase